MIRGFVVAVLSVAAIAGCGGSSSSSSGGGSQTSRLEASLAMWMPNEADRKFFAKEAAAVGVKAIRPMTRSRRSVLTGESSCGYAGEGAIEVRRCGRTQYWIIAHEISQFGVGRACSGGPGDGHGPPFWQYFRNLAAKYKREVPNGGWRDPFGDIADNEAYFVSIGLAVC